MRTRSNNKQPKNERQTKMASPILDQLTAQIEAATTVETSAVAEQLQPVSDLSTAMQTESDALTAAIQAHTP